MRRLFAVTRYPGLMTVLRIGRMGGWCLMLAIHRPPPKPTKVDDLRRNGLL